MTLRTQCVAGALAVLGLPSVVTIHACGSRASEPDVSVGTETAGGGEVTAAGSDAAPCTPGAIEVRETQVCRCQAATYCGGAAPPPELLERLARTVTWSCRARSSDACEDVLAGRVAVGAPCTNEGELCRTDGCCGDAIACSDGIWQDRPGPCPP